MKLTKQDKDKIFELLLELSRKIAGKNTEPLITILYKKKNVNEFKLADKLKLTINQVRNMLYKMLEYNILSSTRKKDKKKGWYTYFWTLEIGKSLEALQKIKERELNVWKSLAHNRKVKQYYSCPNECIELTAETAMHHEFTCPECGELLNISESEKKLKEISTRMNEIKKELEIIIHYAKMFEPKPKLPKKKVKKKRKKKIVKKKVKKKVKKTKAKKKPKKSKKKAKKKGKKKKR